MSLKDIVDLTLSADDEEEEGPRDYRPSNRFPSTSGRDLMTPSQFYPPKSGSRTSPSSLGKAAMNGATPTKPSTQHNRTPSKSTRFSQPPLRDAHGPSSAAAAASASASMQQPTQTSKGYQTPKTATPKKMDWSVDKIAGELTTFAAEVPRMHARVVHYTLQEIFKRAPQPRHLSSVDDFADMPSIAVEPEKSAENNTMSVKFKVRIPQ